MKIRKTILALLVICCVVLLGVAKFTDRSDAPKPSSVDGTWEPFVEIAMQEHEFSVVGSVIEEWTQWQTGAAELAEQYWVYGDLYVSNTNSFSFSPFKRNN